MGRKKRKKLLTVDNKQPVQQQLVQQPLHRPQITGNYPVGSWQWQQQQEWERQKQQAGKVHGQKNYPWEEHQQKLKLQTQQQQNRTSMSNRKIKQVKEFNGIITCLFEHEVVKTTANYEYSGPKLNQNPDTWKEILAFFRWTYDTSKSESQVRLFVNYQTKEWKAWAFPQTEGSGMTTREIDNEDAKTQRAQFPDNEGWFYYGTVHHHCAASAFQSGTDEANERSQDGIHITVGKINTEQYDIDARVYQSGYKLCEFDMHDFWEIGDVFSAVPDHLKEFLPNDFEHKMLLKQMGTPPPADQTFPEIWKTNVIREVRVTPVSMGVNHGPYGGRDWGTVTPYNMRSWSERARIQTEFDAKRFATQVLSYMNSLPDNKKIDIKAIANVIKTAETMFDDDDYNIIDIMLRCDVTPTSALNALNEVEQRIKELKLEKEMDERVGKVKGKLKQLGMPTHTGAAEHMDYEGGGHYAGYGSGYGIGG